MTDKINLSWAVTVQRGLLSILDEVPCCGPWSLHTRQVISLKPILQIWELNEFVGCINLHARHNVTTVWLLEQEIILIVGRRHPIFYILFQHYVNRNKFNSLQCKMVTDSHQLLTAVNNIALLFVYCN